MERIKSYFLRYLKKSSWFRIITDLLFYSFLILLLIPATRSPIRDFIIRTTMAGPRVRVENPVKTLTGTDYSLKFMDMNGTTYQLSDFRGKVILINFWATWCPPCRAEMPAFQKLFTHFKDQMVFLFIAADQKKIVSEYLSEFHLNLPVFFIENLPSGNLYYKTLPSTFLINKKGDVVLEKKGAARWNSAAFRKNLQILIDQD
jgi:thiol-disulfide isomerase/thioredoxin